VALELPEAHFSSHSLRIGAGAGMLHSGADPSAIAVAGRWRSDAMLLYTRWSRHLMVGVSRDMANVDIDLDLPVALPEGRKLTKKAAPRGLPNARL